MLDPSKCLNFVLDADACVESPFDRVTVRSVAAYPTPRRLRTRIVGRRAHARLGSMVGLLGRTSCRTSKSLGRSCTAHSGDFSVRMLPPPRGE